MVPALILNFLSKENRLGPVWGLLLALSVPLGYGNSPAWLLPGYTFEALLMDTVRDSFVTRNATIAGMIDKATGLPTQRFWRAIRRLKVAGAIDIHQQYETQEDGAIRARPGIKTVNMHFLVALGRISYEKLKAFRTHCSKALRRDADAHKQQFPDMHDPEIANRRLREQLSQIPGLTLRRLEDPHGDNGSFLLTRYPDAATAAAMARRLVELGLVCGPHGQLVHYLPDWGFHIYSNIQQLTRKLSNSPDGFPWTHPENRAAPASYDKGTLPRSDELFARSVLQAVPSDTTAEDAEDMIRIYKQAAAELIPGSGAQA